VDERQLGWMIWISLFTGVLSLLLSLNATTATSHPVASEPLVPPLRIEANVVQKGSQTSLPGPLSTPFPETLPLAPYTGILVVPFAQELPPAELQAGRPWHAIQKADGAFEVTTRWMQGRPGLPAGWSPEAVRGELLIAIPNADTLDAQRIQKLREALDWLSHRMDGRPRPRLPDPQSGHTYTVSSEVMEALKGK
jgi:hypothetical protein